MSAAEPPPSGDRVTGWLTAVKGLTISNVLVIALLVVIAIPTYIIWKALNDEKVLDRLMSTYELVETESDCTVRHVQERGGPDLWAVGTGFAFQGRDRWSVNVLFSDMPDEDEIASYCEALKLIVDKMLTGNGQ
jgi:hypothetical protein